MNREIATIKRTVKGVWMQRFDNYEQTFRRISKNEAMECLENARNRGDLFSDDDVNSDMPLVFGYYN